MERTLTSEAKQHIGQTILLKGWIHRIRELGAVNFLILRDRKGLIQCVCDKKTVDLHGLGHESVVEIEGEVKADARAFGGVEVSARKIVVLAAVTETPPIEVNQKLEVSKLGLETILNYRPISLRHLDIRDIWRVEAEFIWAFREYLRGQGFMEVKTSKIVGGATEGGANVFEIKYFGRKAYLAQSPQFYKQIMVGSGFERVFEVGFVYRAEPHATPRHLNEYMSLDYEMGFIRDEQDVIDMEIGCVKHMFNHVEATCADVLEKFGVKVPKFDTIPRIKLKQAFQILIDEFDYKQEDIHDLDPESERLLCQHFAKTHGAPLVYVSHYPVEKRPMYTMPDLTDPGTTRSFDLLYNGLEITTGSQRIHDYNMLVENMRKFNLNPDDFADYLMTFKYGMPPHGGLAIGAERITARLLELPNIREASLFPRDLNRTTP
jgi:nondiscriminating aspartyl-tRNA synthetase